MRRPTGYEADRLQLESRLNSGNTIALRKLLLCVRSTAAGEGQFQGPIHLGFRFASGKGR